MDRTHDELAGIVDLFGALSRDELLTALSELAYREGAEFDEGEGAAAVDEAVEAYYLVEYDDLLVAGPTAFPSLPENAEDLPHIMDVDERAVDREVLGERTRERLRADADAAVDDGDDERLETLIDVSYDVEAWAPVSLDDLRAELDRRP
jgi:hypothetical protein